MAAARFPAGTPAQEEATMVRGFSRPFLPPIAYRARIPAQLPVHGMGEGRSEPGVKFMCSSPILLYRGDMCD